MSSKYQFETQYLKFSGQDQRIAALRSEADRQRNRMNPSDPVNTTLPPGQQPATTSFGY